jgi:hypothetical protein
MAGQYRAILHQHNRLCCIKQSVFQQQNTVHNLLTWKRMEMVNLVLLCHGLASCWKLMQVVRKLQTNGEKEWNCNGYKDCLRLSDHRRAAAYLMWNTVLTWKLQIWFHLVMNGIFARNQGKQSESRKWMKYELLQRYSALNWAKVSTAKQQHMRLNA